jgi:hypothetical protein
MTILFQRSASNTHASPKGHVDSLIAFVQKTKYSQLGARLLLWVGMLMVLVTAISLAIRA